MSPRPCPADNSQNKSFGKIYLKYQQKTKPPKNKFPKRLYGGQPVFDVI